jgi:hypothetical protein
MRNRVGGKRIHRIIGRIPNKVTHKRHSLDAYDAFDREVGLIVDIQEIPGFPEGLFVFQLKRTWV